MQLGLFDQNTCTALARRRQHAIGGFEHHEALLWQRATKGGVPGRLGTMLQVSTIYAFDVDMRLTKVVRMHIRKRFIPDQIAA